MTLLELIACRLCAYRGREIPFEECDRRASVAIILRCRKESASLHRLLDSLRSGSSSGSGNGDGDGSEAVHGQVGGYDDCVDLTDENDLEILLIQRAVNPRDPWSGHTALPGGRFDVRHDKTDRDACVRECWEEVGLSLHQETHFTYLGKLDDRMIWRRWTRKASSSNNITTSSSQSSSQSSAERPVVVESANNPASQDSQGKHSEMKLVIRPFVFLQTMPEPLAMRLDPKEVSAAQWVPLRLLVQLGREQGLVSPVSVLCGSAASREDARRPAMPKTTVQIPVLRFFATSHLKGLLRGTLDALMHSPLLSLKDMVIHFPVLVIPSTSLCATDALVDAREYRLWGLTFEMVSDLFLIATGGRLCERLYYAEYGVLARLVTAPFLQNWHSEFPTRASTMVGFWYSALTGKL
eukprot:ANDGO_07974.mRNA.1 Uncharacterized protein C14C4.10c